MSEQSDISKYLSELNEQQRQAVEYLEGPLLVIAGAGSGKTRVLTYKIMHLLNSGFEPYRILALTFTNKAAREMKSRISIAVGEKAASKLWMGTFHSIFLRILRNHSELIGFSHNFTIYDSADTKSLIKILTQDSKVKIFYFNDVAIIDGNRYKDVEEMGQTVKAIGTLTGAYTGVAGEKRLGVRFRLNEEEKIVMIDTPKTGEPGMSGYVESEDQLTLLKPEGSNNLVGNYILQVPGYNTVCAFKSDAKFATIYPDADDSVHTFSNTVTRGESMKTVAYTTNKNSLLSDFIIWNRDYIPMLNCIVVTHISQSLNEDGDIVYTIGGYGPKGYDERMVNSKVYGDSGEFEKKLESLEIGDVVNYSLNAENEIYKLSIRYKGGDDVVSNEGLYTSQLEPHYTQYDNGVGKYTLTKIIDRVDNVIKVEKTPGLYEYIDVSAVKYISCEKNSKEYIVTPDENKTELGIGKTVLIVVPASSYIPSLIVSYQ